MKDDKKLELLLSIFYERYNRYNTNVLIKIGEAIKKFDGISPSNAHKIEQQLKYGKDLKELEKELSNITKKSIKDIDEAFEIVAKENTSFAETYAKAQNLEYIDYENNEQLKKLVYGISNETKDTFINLSDTRMIGFSVIDKATGKKVFKPLKKAYYDVIDEAVLSVATGTTDYQSAMRKIIKQLASSGVKKIDYESGYARRLDSSVRLNVLEGVRQVNIQVQKQVGDEFGADAVEISAHSPCAEDHLHIQGKQFTKKEFEKINGSLDRPIGELNCKHFVFSILKGINEPSYTNKQLYQMEKESHSIVEYEGIKYTKYEATQVQRKLETAVRRQKDIQIMSRASGDKETVAKAQKNISALTRQYANFSRTAGLDTNKKRMAVSGYRRIKT